MFILWLLYNKAMSVHFEQMWFMEGLSAELVG